jgi:hypothetical protein
VGIVNEEIILKWNPTIIKYYTEKGYRYTKTGDSFIVRLEDLNENSNVDVEVRCDYCDKQYTKRYKNIFTSINKSYTHTYACRQCQNKKILEENVIKQELGLLTRNDRGYWLIKENRLKELQSFITNNNTIDFLATKDRTLYSAIFLHDKYLSDIVSELGYDWDDVCSISLNNYYKDFKNVKMKLHSFIDENNRFPLRDEIITNLNIQQRDIDYHGGMFELKRKMNYFNDEDLVDDNEFVNRSSLEYIVAQYLIKNNIPYEREQYPYRNEGYYRSDFTIEANNETFHVEVWGYSEKHSGEIATKYNIKKHHKISLYSKHKLNLISIEYDYMVNKSLNKVQDYLDSKFSNIKLILNNTLTK